MSEILDGIVEHLRTEHGLAIRPLLDRRPDGDQCIIRYTCDPIGSIGLGIIAGHLQVEQWDRWMWSFDLADPIELAEAIELILGTLENFDV